MKFSTEVNKLTRLKVALITQNLRDGLIKKVFKDANETKELIEEHKKTIGNKIQDVIDASKTPEEFVSSINELKESDEASEDQEHYEKKVNKQVANKQLDVPLKECQAALKSLNNVNLKPLIDASNVIAQKKLTEINDELDKIAKKVKTLQMEINKDVL